MQKNRKAQVESQFNWVFVVIIGALILGFFVYIVIQQRGASEAKFSAKVTQQMQSALIGAGVATGTVQEIGVPNVEIAFTCNDYYIGPAAQRLGNAVVFAPSQIKGSQILTWTLEWDVPFKIMNFLYITNPLVRYVFVYNANNQTSNDAAAHYEDVFPESMNADFLEKGEVADMENLNDNKIRFVFLNVEPASVTIPDSLSGEDISGLKRDGSDNKVTFYSFNGDSFVQQSGIEHAGPYYFLDDESFFGAVFTDDPAVYECVMARAYDRLKLIVEIYKKRFVSIQRNVRTECQGLYAPANLDSLSTGADNWFSSANNIANTMETFNRINQRAQLLSCPLLY